MSKLLEDEIEELKQSVRELEAKVDEAIKRMDASIKSNRARLAQMPDLDREHWRDKQPRRKRFAKSRGAKD